MFFLYNFLGTVLSFLLRFVALFSSKIELFLRGRKDLFKSLKKKIDPNDKIIWIHAASLGEYEQGLPVLELLKQEYPSHKYLISFFSPSGYEVKKDSHEADYITYIPLDTKKNSKKYLDTVNPVLAVFIKYEIWPNMLQQLSKREIPSILISSIFNKKQTYFKWYGGFMRNALFKFEHIFVQNLESRALLNSIGYNEVTISGDTRFDRVSKILSQKNKLDYLDTFKKDTFCFVMGSTWKEDEELLIPYINGNDNNLTFIIAPHKISADHLQHISEKITKNTQLLSEYIQTRTENTEVLLVDSIGLLTKIYGYADLAYVGGGFATGLHNTLEPAVFRIPVLIGPRYHGFKEAEDLVKLGGIIPISSYNELAKTADNFVKDNEYCNKVGGLNAHYVQNKTGASVQIVTHIRKLL